MSQLNRAVRAGSAGAAIAAVICGCVAGPKFVEPTAARPATYTAAPLTHLQADSRPASESDASAWWLPLHSAQLDATIRLALDRNRDLAAARATLGEVQELAAASEGARYPNLDFEASAGRQKYGAAFLGPQKLPPFSFYSNSNMHWPNISSTRSRPRHSRSAATWLCRRWQPHRRARKSRASPHSWRMTRRI
jgi:outer membrane protein TolC